MNIITSKDKQEIEKIKQRSKENLELALNKVKPIIKDVKTFKDKSLINYSKKFDSAELTKSQIQVSKQEIEKAYKKVDKNIIKAIKQAKETIKQCAELQLPKEWKKQIRKGITVGQLIRPLDSVGCYVPGGNFPLPSTALMTVIPAKVAGVKEIIVCTPPKENIDTIIVAADIAGADKIFRVGGAQAIAAMAYGTETIPKVNKIVGPGNIFVTAAKKLVYGDVGLDFLAGPSEIMIFAEQGDEKIIAADLISQAEHDVLASSILVTTNKELAEKVKDEVKSQLNNLSTSTIASKSINTYGAIIIADNIDQAFDLINDFAPEHLEIISDDQELLKKVNNAGAIFLGPYSAEAVGDYAINNHVLPTGQFAKSRAGLSTLDFIKTPSFQHLTKEALNSLKETITTIAKTEGLDAHRKSIEVRFK
ncbi:MAG: histidinol dehydrogenase [Candidatus Woesearchaeota archaeon]|jgi:histidinol dehydrogenase|nr:histidinol dehydrogenase [Candidatus Woesearchaeota archaeon]